MNTQYFPYKKERQHSDLDPCSGCAFEHVSGRCYPELVKNKVIENLGSCGDDSSIYIKINQVSIK